MRNRYSIILTTLLVALLAACPKGGKGPGGMGGLPDKPDVPGGGVPGGLGGSSGMVDPNSCGNYSAQAAGAKLKAFLEALVEMQKTAEETVKVVKQSCIMLGTEIGMIPADLEGETKEVCARVYGEVDKNMKVVVKSKAAFKLKYKPAVCTVNVQASAKAAAECEGKASADVGAKCSGTCRGKCNGTCAGKAGTGGNAGDCNGECKGTCEGKCEGHADVNASAQCKAQASVKANADIECTKAELDVSLDAKLVVDKSKAEKMVNGFKKALPEIFSVKARLEPLKYAAQNLVSAAAELKDMGPKFVNSFKDQALCISGQLAAAVKAATSIQANVSVSVEVSASASGSVGAGG
jgi:modification target Cys-rich repeat protein